jgi:tRNA A-37 threonylcarbamoyl transferase component Bud32
MPDSTATSSPSPQQPSPAAKTRSFAGYEVEGELGRGGMGVVYLARQIKLNRRVALKTLTGHYGKEELERFLAEAETAAGLHHTNIAHIYEVGEQDGVPFYSLEYVEGGSVADQLRKELPTVRDAAKLLILVARALHFAHQNGVVHRDMKPANVLLDSDGVPKVADFGIAKRLKQDSQLTVSGAVIGTPTYMAPEQAKGTSRHVGPAADVYSLGAILYEMLTGRPPFLPEDSETAITIRVLTEDPVSPAWHRPEIPRDLEVICMKCLEKEPRDRYESAAAFAEDLRRFLDDETIVARPPTPLVRTIKWMRRHPWKFVSSATALLMAVAGIIWMTHWELYQRTHRQYAMDIDYRYGGPEPLGALSASDAAHRAVSLRFTRRGRWGQVVRVEALNPHGYPTNLSQFFNQESLPNWIEGASGINAETRKTRESTSMDFVYDNRIVTEAIARDCNGMLTWRLIYDRPSATNPNRIHARYVTARGFDFASRSGASLIEFERDTAGRDMKITFFSGSGQPAANAEGVYGYAVQRDQAGRLIHLINLGKDRNPGPNKAGQIAFAFRVNARGLIERIEFRDGEDKGAPFEGIFSVATEFNGAANATRLVRLDDNNHPVSTSKLDWAVQEVGRNEQGEIIEQRFFSVNGTGQPTLVRKIQYSYDDHGFPNDVRFTGQTTWHSAFKFDDRGNVLQEAVLGPDGKPAPGAEGWAIRRCAWQFSADGYRQEETWFNANGGIAYARAGQHRRITEYDASGNLYRETTDQHDPAHYSYQRWVVEPEYDAQGRERHTIAHYQDANGQPATNAGLPYTTREVTLDEEERDILEWKLGCPPEVGAPVLRIDTEWHRTGARKRVFRQACDENRKPIAVLSNGTPARMEQDFNEIDKLERIYETGFDESLLGYSTREAKFDSGKLLNVVHRRSDGTALDSVIVTVKYVEPQQPKVKELLPGDQLVAANDRAVTTAYAWVAAGEFPGGWIEVIRNGKRLRIEGFQQGALGIVLEDRAPR